ncbi:toxin-antitoxin system, toxin component family protein [Streptomyces arenae]|uniref:toxin-antitoxin system, toxin component family protein n=1 Tax=Streptomyces arenae TaxID=29301 RepID=UPI002657C853|nr:toxin-antitoxin system, toxin component family protein [Streptomyces arenae]MCG7206812.1 toxin-antitoxin system, toxin component family protein [Streptomyces arenae]
MDLSGARHRWARIVARLPRPRPDGRLRRPRANRRMRALAAGLTAAVRARPRPPAGAREVCRALCEEMTALRAGRPVELRFERFPDELEVTGVWVEFQDFDLVIVEERAEAVQQLVILGHELWHLHAGHRHPHGADAAAARALAGRPGWRERALTVAARNGSRAADEAAADDFGHRLATALRPYVERARHSAPDPVQRSLGYRGRGGAAR